MRVCLSRCDAAGFGKGNIHAIQARATHPVEPENVKRVPIEFAWRTTPHIPARRRAEDRAYHSTMGDCQCWLAILSRFREPAIDPLENLSRAFAPKRGEIQTALLVRAHRRAQVRAQIFEAAALPFAP